MLKCLKNGADYNNLHEAHYLCQLSKGVTTPSLLPSGLARLHSHGFFHVWPPAALTVAVWLVLHPEAMKNFLDFDP